MISHKKTSAPKPLPTSKKEMLARGWQGVDIVLVTGDAYIDHPSFGVALIGRWLEAHGFTIAILSQPRHQTAQDFTTFGQPRLFFGITAGNLDSIVANYSGNGKVRDRDDYSPAGNPYFSGEKSKKNRRRPDRATILYTNLARAAYPATPVILGGLEASLRRFGHYDYQQKKLRASILSDAKGDLLVYGMGERAVVEIANRLTAGHHLKDIGGTCRRLTDKEMADESSQEFLTLPSWEAINRDRQNFMKAEQLIDTEARSQADRVLRQRQQSTWVVQNRPAAPLTGKELDRLYELPFSYAPHPKDIAIPAWQMIRDSLTIVRGCYGNCSFCAITRHQGAMVTSRSPRSILAEIARRVASPDFRGTISDLGGPTANMYATSCSQKNCRRHDCLFPKVCKNLTIDEQAFIDLLSQAGQIKGVKNLFISSGLRMELLLKTPRLLGRILQSHTPGALKIAPEHTEPEVLRLMHKHQAPLLPKFLKQCRELATRQGLTIHLTPYLISGHPGCTIKHMEKMAATLQKLGLKVRQFQDFTPTPGTLATAMYVSGLDRDSLTPIHVATKTSERRVQRQVLEKIMTSGRPRKRKGPKGTVV